MLSARPWRLEAIVRLGIALFVSMYSGLLVLSLIRAVETAKSGLGFYALFGGALFCLATTLILLRKPCDVGLGVKRLVVMLGAFYVGLVLGAWVLKIAGPAAASAQQMVVAVMSFQGACLILTIPFLREHHTTWADAFGIRNQRYRAVVLGGIMGCMFLPVGWALQQLSVQAILHAPLLRLSPEVQQAVQTLQNTSNWGYRFLLGLLTIAIAPPAEEILFRGVLYPFGRDAGFPRLALWGTSILFGAIHMNMVTFIPLTVMALVLTALYERTGNLLAPITAHSGFNLLNFLRLSFPEGRQGDLYMIVITASLLAILLTALWLAVRHERV